MTPTDNIFWPYFQPILEAQKAEQGVVYIQMSDANGMDRMIEDSASSDVYPGIFVFRPKYSTQRVENHILMANFITQWYVFCKGDLDDRTSQDLAYRNAELIVSKIMHQLQHDSRTYTNFLDFDSVIVEPVIYNTGADCAFGYEVKMKLALPAQEIFC